MDTVRYVLAVMTMVSLPPGFLLWFFIHPFARHWRKLGPVWTYVVLTPVVVVVMVALFLQRRLLLSTDLGLSLPLVVLGIVGLACGATITVRRRKHLTSKILSGIPELSADPADQKLLTQGIYGTIRHPRYIEALLWVLGYAFIANYVGLYVLFVLSIPTVFLIVLLEERELRERFGAEYEEYCRRVPRFVPRSSTGRP